jgi:hypothetical protein
MALMIASSGLVTSSTASGAFKPSARTVISTMGTLICGSSSRGMVRSAIRPTASAASRNNGVNGERMVACVSRPEIPSFTAAQLVPGVQPGKDFDTVWKLRARQVAAALDRNIDRSGSGAHVDVIDSEPGQQEACRNDEGAALPARYPDPDSLADEIIPQPFNPGIGDDAAVLDLRIDEGNAAELWSRSAEFGGVDTNRIAGLEKPRVTFRDAQAQDEILLGNHRDRLTRQHHGSGRHRLLENTTGGRREHATLRELLLNHGPFSDARSMGVGRHIECRADLVEARLRSDALAEQLFSSVDIDLGLPELRLQSGDLRVERFHLEHELLVADRGDDLAGLDPIALLHL